MVGLRAKTFHFFRSPLSLQIQNHESARIRFRRIQLGRIGSRPPIKSTIVRDHRDRLSLPVARHETLKELDGAANAPYREDPIMA